MFGKILIGVALATVGQVDFAAAQQQLPAATQQTATIKRTPLQKFDVPGPTTKPSLEWPRSCRT